MLAQDGGWTTTRRLRHQDHVVDLVTKARYHAVLRAKGLEIPTSEQEMADPRMADAQYSSAVNWLREQTRGDQYKLLLDENIDYGFRRNLVALKPAGILVLVASITFDGYLLYAGKVTQDTRWLAGGALVLILFMALGAWLFILRKSFVQDAADAYADRLLRCCEKL
jgi:hypothetical protein